MAQQPQSATPWSLQPDEDETGMQFQIERVPKQGMRGLHILSHDPLGARIHWIGSRSMPCIGDTCRLCHDGNPRRWYGWLAVQTTSTGRTFILEYTSAAAFQVNEYFNEHRTLRGAQIELWRKPQRANGRLCLFIRPGITDRTTIPKGPSRKTILAQMWGVDLNNFDTGEVQAKLQKIEDQAQQKHFNLSRGNGRQLPDTTPNATLPRA